jgi:hypothetical protein
MDVSVRDYQWHRWAWLQYPNPSGCNLVQSIISSQNIIMLNPRSRFVVALGSNKLKRSLYIPERDVIRVCYDKNIIKECLRLTHRANQRLKLPISNTLELISQFVHQKSSRTAARTRYIIM